MPIRFRRTFKILPGVKLNVNKGSISVTVGTRGYNLTFGRQGVRQTIDLPGEGLSHTSYLFKDDDDKRRNNDPDRRARRTARDRDDDDGDAVGCFPFGCVIFVLLAAAAAYFVADAYQWIPENYLSNLMQQVTRWLQTVGR